MKVAVSLWVLQNETKKWNENETLQSLMKKNIK